MALPASHVATCLSVDAPARSKTNSVIFRASAASAKSSNARQALCSLPSLSTTFVSSGKKVPASSFAVCAAASNGAASEAVTYHFLMANAEFLLNEEEHFQEQMKERLRLFQERGQEVDFWLLYEPEFLANHKPELLNRVKRPVVALVSTNATWMTFMKLRLDRVLKGSFQSSSREEALKAKPCDLEFPVPSSWDAPYPKYEGKWWEPFAPSS